MTLLIADYDEPRGKIRGLADRSSPWRAAFLEGGENFGKSYLLECLKPELAARKVKLIIARLEKRRGIPTPIQVMTEIGDELDWKYLSNLRRAVDEVTNRHISATVSNVQVENSSYVNIQAIAEENDQDRLLVANRVTREFLQDLRDLPDSLKPLILAFDGYDPSMSLIESWFDSSLLHGLCSIDHVRLIVCGRKLPQTTVKARPSPGLAIEVALQGVKSEQDWMPIITTLKRRIPGENDDHRLWYLRGLIDAHNGAPGFIMMRLNLLQSE